MFFHSKACHDIQQVYVVTICDEEDGDDEEKRKTREKVFRGKLYGNRKS